MFRFVSHTLNVKNCNPAFNLAHALQGGRWQMASGKWRCTVNWGGGGLGDYPFVIFKIYAFRSHFHFHASSLLSAASLLMTWGTWGWRRWLGTSSFSPESSWSDAAIHSSGGYHCLCCPGDRALTFWHFLTEWHSPVFVCKMTFSSLKFDILWHRGALERIHN